MREPPYLITTNYGEKTDKEKQLLITKLYILQKKLMTSKPEEKQSLSVILSAYKSFLKSEGITK